MNQNPKPVTAIRTNFLKKTAASLLAMLLLPATAIADGVYDGIWEISYPFVTGEYFTIHQVGNTVALISIGVNDANWGAAMGEIEGNRITTFDPLVLKGESTSTFTIEFFSGTAGWFTLDTCSPFFVCDFLPWEIGEAVRVDKVF